MPSLHGRQVQPLSLELAGDPRGTVTLNVKGLMKRIDHGAITEGPGGSFQVGETVTGGSSSDTVEVVHTQPTFLIYREITGPLQDAETLTGGTSGATATSTSAPAIEAHRFLFFFRGSVGQGTIESIRHDLITSAGSVYTTFDVEILDTDDVGAPLNLQNTLFRDVGISAPSAPAKIQSITNVGRGFVLKGTENKVQIAISPAGGAINSDQSWRSQIYGIAKS